jgi:hypothetical protein
VAIILKESGTMWRWKAVVGVLWLTAGCATMSDQRANRITGVDTGEAAETEMEGCLRIGAAPGRFAMTGVTASVASGSSAGAVDVMSTRVGLTEYVGRRIAVRGQQHVTPSRSIHDGATLFHIWSLDVVEAECRAR